MEENERKEDMEERDKIYTKTVRAGKRTYFFDMKRTRNEDYYLTITESKRKVDMEGSQNFEKHKVFLYKEDFEKFSEGLNEVINYIKVAMSDKNTISQKSDFDSVDFDQI